MALAPEHPLIDKITAAEQRGAVKAYVEQAGRKSEIERMTEGKEKTGVFSGSYRSTRRTRRRFRSGSRIRDDGLRKPARSCQSPCRARHARL